jgi:hypothetical protein
VADIKAKGADKDYGKTILDMVKAIKGRPVGRVIVEAIESSGKLLTIRPESERPKGSFDPNRTYTGSVAATFPVDAAAKPNYAAASPANLSRTAKDGPGKWYAGRSDNDGTEDVDERYDPAPDGWGDPKGSGSDVYLFFTPGGGDDKACSNGSSFCAELPDEILLHEMVHALRDMQGVTNPVPTRTLRYKNEEEFLALVITNVYISKQKGNTLLRKDYIHYGALEPPWNTSEGFLKDDEHRSILEYYSGVWQPVFGLLGEVATLFNPFSRIKGSGKPKPVRR